MKNNEIKIKMNANAEAIAKILEDIAASIKCGKICVQRGADFVTLIPSESMDIEMEAIKKKGKQKLTLELTWRNVVSVKDTGADLAISSEEPEIEKPESETVPEDSEAVTEGMDD